MGKKAKKMEDQFKEKVMPVLISNQFPVLAAARHYTK